MLAESFEETSISWQLRLLQKRLGEWWEWQISQTDLNVDPPFWWNNPTLQLLAQAIFWLVVALLLIWVTLQLMRLLTPYFYALKAQLNSQNRKTSQTTVAEKSVANWLKRSQQFQQQGKYHEACLCLYQAMLQRLDETGIAPQQLSRTDGEYEQLVAQLPQSQPYQTLLAIHQQLCFSKAKASSVTFEQCQKAYQDIFHERF